MDIKKILRHTLSWLRRQGRLRILGGEVDTEKISKLNALRHELMSKNPDYVKYLERKSTWIRTCVNVFNNNPMVFMALAEKTKEAWKP